MSLMNFLQAASNSAADTVAAPVDLFNFLLGKAGVNIPEPVGGSAWMERQGLRKKVPQNASSLAGETVGLLSPVVAAAKAPQIAKGLLDIAESAPTAQQMAGMSRGQRGAFVFPQDEALRTAQKNAAKPVSEGGLGLRPDNTAAERARAMGYVDAYHGTADDIAKIDRAKFGSATGANSAKKAFWLVDNPSVARGYAEHAATDAKVKRLIDAADKAEKRGQWDLYDKLVSESEALDSLFRANPLQGQNIMPLMVRANKGVKGIEMDAGGKEFVDLEGGVNRFLNQAIAGQKDLAIIKNLADDVGLNGRPATHYAALNPSVVRSRFAAFDPARRDSADILAGLAALGIGVPLFASNGNGE